METTSERREFGFMAHGLRHNRSSLVAQQGSYQFCNLRNKLLYLIRRGRGLIRLLGLIMVQTLDNALATLLDHTGLTGLHTRIRDPDWGDPVPTQNKVAKSAVDLLSLT